tara:strand:+ start:490 stop:1413 length:924 start_codon:yes stop_codon:yes gene_type:complete
MNRKTIINYKELENKINNKTLIYVSSVKHTLKILKLDTQGKKKELIERLYQYYKVIHYYTKYIDTIIFIQNRMKQKIKKRCVNIEDFYTLDKLDDIEPQFFYSYIDQNKFRYGFDIRSLKKLLIKTKINPYNRLNIPEYVIQSINNRIKIIETQQPETNVSTPIDLTEDQRIKNKIFDVFEKIDSLNIITFSANTNWFMKLSFNSLKKLYRGLEDIWNYRAQISTAEKNKIIPGNNIFNYNINNILNMMPETKNKLKHIILDEINKLVSSGIETENKKNGAYYVLIALTEVSQDCAQSIPWLSQSNY